MDARCLLDRGMVACGISPGHCDSGAHNTNVAVRLPGPGMGYGILLFNGDGGGHFLLLLPHVLGAGSL